MEAVHAFEFVDPDVRGNFPGRSPAPDRVAKLPFALRTFLEGGKQLEVAFKRAVDIAIVRAAAAKAGDT
ncbi:hypothetical protein DYB32_010233 [Aphanomyces invadans]|nr:hypothetical protein DYB32_010233 [Aphanomyces invadans]